MPATVLKVNAKIRALYLTDARVCQPLKSPGRRSRPEENECEVVEKHAHYSASVLASCWPRALGNHRRVKLACRPVTLFVLVSGFSDKYVSIEGSRCQKRKTFSPHNPRATSAKGVKLLS